MRVLTHIGMVHPRMGSQVEAEGLFEEKSPQLGSRKKLKVRRNHSEGSMEDFRNIRIRSEEARQKTVTRTFRMDESLNESLEVLAEESQVTPSNLLNQILTQFVNWNRFVNTRDSPFITLYFHTLYALMEAQDEDKLLEIARQTETEATIDYIKYRWGRLSVENFVKYLRLLSSYSNQGQFNFIRSNSGKELKGGEGNGREEERLFSELSEDSRKRSGTNGREEVDPLLVVAIRHRLGIKWSKFLGAMVTSVFEAIDGVAAEYELSNNSCFVLVKKGSKKKNNHSSNSNSSNRASASQLQ